MTDTTAPSLADIAAPAPRAFRVEYPGPGKAPDVTLDGVDISGLISAYEIHHDHTQSIPEVVLVLNAAGAGKTLFDGLASVSIADPDPAAIVAFLAECEPEDVESAALNRMDLGNGPGATTQAILRTLMDLAKGAGGGA